MAASPTKITIHTYQVGFGDCFLLKFHYPKFERNVLIDFGSTGLPKGTAAKNHMLSIAEDIKARCSGKLHAVVATHRHKDHISGFAPSKGKGPGDIIRSLKPDVVVQPWTEDPKAQKDAKRPTKLLGGHAAAPELQHIAALDEMRAVAGAALHAGRRMRKALDFDLASELAFIGDDNLANLPAVENLMTMGKNVYVYAGSRSGLEDLLPNLKVHVLGPPTIEQSAAIQKQRAKDGVEFWQFWRHQASAANVIVGNGQRLFPRAEVEDDPPYARWFRRRLTEVHGDSLLRLVRILDDAMNNTSVILVFEVGGKRLLFSGDAQIENWSYALSQPDVRKLLRDIDLYKVGHHGSLNATPKQALWPLFRKRSKTKGPKRLKTLVSTMLGKHGHEDRGTEVPRRNLVTELKAHTDFFTTQNLHATMLSHETVISLE